MTATISPVSGSSIGVTVWMPTQGYNGRYLGTGNGGYAGSYFDSELAQGINDGFATANTDMGTGQCLSYGVNAQFCAEFPQSWIDFGWRATYWMTQFAKALITAFYGSSPDYSYFAGCSTGGQQALMEAQRFPNDYNGILAGDPANYRTHLHVAPVAQYFATHSSTTGAPSGGYTPVPSGFDAVNAAVLTACVGRDGGAPSDTFLNNPRVCTFNPAAAQCPNGTGTSCLTPPQVATFQGYYQGPVNPVTGASIFPGNAPGSEADTALGLGLAYNENLNEPSFDGLFYWVFGLNWQWETFDFNNNVAQVDQALGQDLNATSTDLSAFKNAGGKLIQYHGWADPLIASISSIDYYNDVTKTMVGNLSNSATQQTQNFYRLYMAPGMWHCGDSLAGGPGPNSFGGMIQQPAPSYDPQHNLLSALTQWVEHGTPPGPVIATKYVQDTPSLGIAMQRPICVYPQIAEYNGTGDPTQPTSFSCQPGPNVAAHEFNNDGYSDILWLDTTGDTALWVMNGASVLQSAGVGAVPPSVWSIVGQRDFNGDGKADILWHDTSGDVAIWFMSGAQVSQSLGVGNAPTAWSIVGAGDFFGNGNGGILWRDNSGDVAIWELSGNSIVQSCGVGNAPPNWSIAGTGDFVGNGTTDILWHDTAGDVAIWELNGCSVIQSAGVGAANPSVWSITGIGDFNGDGKSDILWRDTSGDVAIWEMNGTTILQSAGVGNASPSVWSIAQTGDYYGAGTSDILWRDTSGDVAVWQMNGATVSQSAGIGTAPTVWTIQGAGAD